MAILFDKTYDLSTSALLDACAAELAAESSVTDWGITPTRSGTVIALDNAGNVAMQLAAQSAIVQYPSGSTVGDASITTGHETPYLRVVATENAVYFYYANTNPTTSATYVSTTLVITNDSDGNKIIVYCDDAAANYFYVIPFDYAGIGADIPKIQPMTVKTGFPQCCVYGVPSPVAVSAYLESVYACVTLPDNIVCGNVDIADEQYICVARHTANTNGQMAFVMLKIS